MITVNSVTDKLLELQERRKQILEEVQVLRQELDKIDFAVSVLKGTITSSSANLSTTPEGRIRDLTGAIKRTLEAHGVIMTASDLRDVLYDNTLTITPEQMRRRLSVKTSFLNKGFGHKPQLIDSGFRSDSREIYWTLPQWLVNGEVDRKRLPEKLKDKNPTN